MFRLREITDRLGGEIVGDECTQIRRVAPIERAGVGDIAFVAQAKYSRHLKDCKASAVIVNPSMRADLVTPAILCANPYVYFARVAQLLLPETALPAGCHPSAVVDSAVPASAHVGANAVVGKNVTFGENVVVGPGCCIGDNVSIGSGTLLHANVTVYSDCIIGRACILHSGAIIGSDGFGFARENSGAWVKIPQVGRVVIGDDVEVGANTTIDRGALDDTVISDGVKLDNLIQVAHNVRIGEHTAMAGHSGVAGSSRIGARCMIGGQSGISGHIEVCDDVVISGCTLVPKTIKKPGVYTSALPLQGHADWVTNFAHLRHLDALAKRVRELEKRLSAS